MGEMNPRHESPEDESSYLDRLIQKWGPEIEKYKGVLLSIPLLGVAGELMKIPEGVYAVSYMGSYDPHEVARFLVAASMVAISANITYMNDQKLETRND